MLVTSFCHWAKGVVVLDALHLATVALCWKSHEETKKSASFKVDLLITEWLMSSPPSFGRGTCLLAVHHQETAAQSPRPGEYGALLVPVIPDRHLPWISEGLRDQGRLPAVQQAPKCKC